MAGLSLGTCLMAVLLAGLGCGSSAGETVFSSVGGYVTLPCGINIHRSCSAIVWRLKERFEFFLEVVRSGRVTANDPERARRLQLGRDCSLHISNISTKDGGQYICEDETTTTTTTLQLLNITVLPSTDLHESTEACLHCYLITATGYVLCNHSGVRVHWVSERGTELQGNRYQILNESPCYSKLVVKLRRTDHNRQWRCQLTEETEVKTTYSYTTTLTDGVEEIFASVGRTVTLPCINSAASGVGRLQWFLGGKVPLSQSPDGDVMELDSREIPGFTMNADSSLVIKAVNKAHSGYYQCKQVNDSGFILTHRRILLYTLEVNADPTGLPQQNLNYTLTCSLTCAKACNKDLNLTWIHSAGGHQQGGAVVDKNNTLISQLFVPNHHASEKIVCIVLAEGEEKARQEWAIQRDYAVAAVVCCVLLTLLICAASAGIYLKRSREANTGSTHCNIGMVNNMPLYEDCGEPVYSRVSLRAIRGSSGQEQPQMVNTIYALQSAVNQA